MSARKHHLDNKRLQAKCCRETSKRYLVAITVLSNPCPLQERREKTYHLFPFAPIHASPQCRIHLYGEQIRPELRRKFDILKTNLRVSGIVLLKFKIPATYLGLKI